MGFFGTVLFRKDITNVCFVQEEEKLLAAVDESQSKLLDQKNEQAEQKLYLSKAKAELDKRICGLQENSRYLAILLSTLSFKKKSFYHLS